MSSVSERFPFRILSAVDEVEEYLRLRIQSGIYVAGERLPPERALTAELNVARPTLRQALDRLKVAGYVDAKQGSRAGTYVTDLVAPTKEWLAHIRRHREEFEDIYQFDFLVETGAAEMAATRRSTIDLGEMQLAIDQLRVLVQLDSLGDQAIRPEYAPLRGADTFFHQAVAVGSGSPRLADAAFRVRGELFTAGVVIRYTSEQLVHVKSEHEAVLDAIRAGDATGAREAMAAHVTAGRLRYSDVLGW